MTTMKNTVVIFLTTKRMKYSGTMTLSFTPKISKKKGFKRQTYTHSPFKRFSSSYTQTMSSSIPLHVREGKMELYIKREDVIREF